MSPRSRRRIGATIAIAAVRTARSTCAPAPGIDGACKNPFATSALAYGYAKTSRPFSGKWSAPKGREPVQASPRDTADADLQIVQDPGGQRGVHGFRRAEVSANIVDQ